MGLRLGLNVAKGQRGSTYSPVIHAAACAGFDQSFFFCHLVACARRLVKLAADPKPPRQSPPLFVRSVLRARTRSSSVQLSGINKGMGLFRWRR
jgi:hypothetical protein